MQGKQNDKSLSHSMCITSLTNIFLFFLIKIFCKRIEGLQNETFPSDVFSFYKSYSAKNSMFIEKPISITKIYQSISFLCTLRPPCKTSYPETFVWPSAAFL